MNPLSVCSSILAGALLLGGILAPAAHAHSVQVVVARVVFKDNGTFQIYLMTPVQGFFEHLKSSRLSKKDFRRLPLMKTEERAAFLKSLRLLFQKNVSFQVNGRQLQTTITLPALEGRKWRGRQRAAAGKPVSGGGHT